MAKYELTNKAVTDLNRIWEYTLENGSENQADRYYDMLLDICHAQHNVKIQLKKNEVKQAEQLVSQLSLRLQ